MSQKMDLTNMRFGHLVALYPLEPIKSHNRKNRVWHCICDCGKEKDIREYSLVHNSVKSCGCRNGIKYVGQRFGSLVVLEATGKKSASGELMTCRCDCGNIKEVGKEHLKRGAVTSCGCHIGRQIDISGQKRGMLTALRKTGKRDEFGASIYEWSCECGNIVERSIRNSLKNNQMCPACLKKLKARQAEAARARIQGIAEIALNNIKDGSLTKANKSGIRGVHWNASKQRWIATGRKDGKPIDLGRFENLEDAKAAREKFVRKEYGSSALEKGEMVGLGFGVGDCYLPGV